MYNFSVAKNAEKKSTRRGPYKARAEDPNKLGTGDIRLRQWRLFRDMTVGDVASGAGASQGTITGIENRNVGWSHTMLFKLARAVDTTVGALLEVDPRSDPTFWLLWTKANKQQRQRITDQMIGIVGVPAHVVH